MKKIKVLELVVSPYSKGEKAKSEKSSPNDEGRMKKLMKIEKQDLRAKMLKKIKKKQKLNKFPFEKKTLHSQIKKNLKKISGKQFSCCLCYGAMIQPIGTVCGHIFCQMCLQDALLYQDRCPVCRASIREEGSQKLQGFAKLSTKYWKTFDNKQYLEQVSLQEEYHKKRWIRVEEVGEGYQIDVRNQRCDWLPGKAIRVLRYGTVVELLVTYEQNDKTFTELIEADSERLAPRGLFTARQGISENPWGGFRNSAQHGQQFTIVGFFDGISQLPLETPPNSLRDSENSQ